MSYLGTSAKAPLNKDGGTISDLANIQASLTALFNCEYGTSAIHPTYGIKASVLLLEPNTVILRNILMREMKAAIERWEARVTLVSVVVRGDGADIAVDIAVRIKASNELFSFVWPFYKDTNF